MKILFLGTPEFAAYSLDKIVKGGYNVVGVVTMPDKPAGRGKKLMQSPVKQYAVEHGLPVFQPVKLKDPEFIEQLRALDADLFIVIAFRMLPEVVWQMPRLGTFNLHASLLPRYRGAAPINWAVINGDTETGVTTFFLKHEIDTGDIIARERIEIGPDDNVGTVHDRLMELGAALTVKTIDSIIAGTLTTIPQEQMATMEATEPTAAPKIFHDTCRIDWTLPAQRVHNLVRGMSPYPGAWSLVADDNAEPVSFKIFETRLTDAPSTDAPGTIKVDGKRMFVNTADRRIEVLALQAPGKRRMSADEFLRGWRYSNPRFTT
ncbi:MAG: methionyl-tRNA formyltransferase [Muribaculaceae bacterium]|nr:methionyl-tRNA formyltransferase [Muribaculaceae bacterium]